MVHYKLVKITIDTLGLAEVIINVVIRHYSLPDLIVTYQGSLFISKFWLLLCYFLNIKRRLLTAFHLQTNGQTDRQNSIIEAYLWAFINFGQNNWVQLLLMAEFAYNNTKNPITGYILFKLNYRYHLYVSYEKDFNPCLKSKTAKELSFKLWDLMAACQQNLHYAQKVQKWAHYKRVKPQSYALSEKVLLNSKYFKTK